MRGMYAFLLALVLVAGCGGGDSNLEDSGLSESIVGTWVSEKDVYITFNPDGSYDVGTEVGIADREFGAWSAEGNVLTKVTDEDSRYCAGIVGTYESNVVDDGQRLESTIVSDECQKRVEDFLSLSRNAESDP